MPLEDFEVIQCAKKASVVLAAEAAFAGGGVRQLIVKKAGVSHRQGGGIWPES